jgi:hypothetical protein
MTLEMRTETRAGIHIKCLLLLSSLNKFGACEPIFVNPRSAALERDRSRDICNLITNTPKYTALGCWIFVYRHIKGA